MDFSKKMRLMKLFFKKLSKKSEFYRKNAINKIIFLKSIKKNAINEIIF